MYDKIIKGENRVEAIVEDERVIVFASPEPMAKVHFICLAKRLGLHSLADVKETPEDEALLGHLMVTAAKVA